jgi:hypothetical protein
MARNREKKHQSLVHQMEMKLKSKMAIDYSKYDDQRVERALLKEKRKTDSKAIEFLLVQKMKWTLLTKSPFHFKRETGFEPTPVFQTLIKKGVFSHHLAWNQEWNQSILYPLKGTCIGADSFLFYLFSRHIIIVL